MHWGFAFSGELVPVETCGIHLPLAAGYWTELCCSRSDSRLGLCPQEQKYTVSGGCWLFSTGLIVVLPSTEGILLQMQDDIYTAAQIIPFCKPCFCFFFFFENVNCAERLRIEVWTLQKTVQEWITAAPLISIRETCSQGSVTGSAATGVPSSNSSICHLADTGTLFI